MVYEFLKDFHRRAEIVAIVDFITTRVSRKIKFRNYEFDGSEAINLVMLVLCFIMEKSLVEEVCSKNEVAGYIRRLDIDFLKKNIPDEEYLNIADYLIKDCLQNSGIPHYFTTYDFQKNKEEKINVKLIDDKRVMVGNEVVYSYYMTPQGYKFMFNTLEIEDAMKVSIEQFKLGLSIKKRNFNGARNNVDSLFNISKTQIQRINYFIKRVKEDIGNAGIDEYESIYNSTFSAINEQKEGYDNLYELIGKVEASILESNSFAINRDAVDKEIENIAYIKSKLKYMIGEQSNLLLKQQELQKIYNEAVDNILFIGFENRLDFEEHVVKKFEENPELALPIVKILRPLFKPGLDKIFNIKKALKEQRISALDENYETSSYLMTDRQFNRFESENEIKIRKINEMYVDIFEIICKNAMLSKDNEISLSHLVKELHEDYAKFVPDLKILTNVLLQLTSIKEIDFTTIMKQKEKTVFNPSEAFDIKYCVLELISRNTVYNTIKNFKILLSRKESVFVPQKLPALRDEGLFSEESVTGLNCPDLLFKVEVNGN
ncbi:MAG TPA: hypothetical protein VIO64_09160 [Pseudobacteroides sp.]|uniref:hypothetical protein n=1 Tax=Pseudobacteroides sp. TaxID=1968840 RepID=UPI002F950ED1